MMQQPSLVRKSCWPIGKGNRQPFLILECCFQRKVCQKPQPALVKDETGPEAPAASPTPRAHRCPPTGAAGRDPACSLLLPGPQRKP